MSTFDVNGQTYDVQDVYAAGHTLNDAEAAALNEVRTRKIAAAWGQRIRQTAKRGAEFDSSQAALEAYAAAYKLGEMPRGPAGKGAKDPYAAEAKKIATKLLTDHVKSQGHKPADYANFDELVAELAAREDIVAQARDRIEAAKAITVGELPLELAPPAPTEPVVAEGEQSGPPAPEQPAENGGRKNRRRE